MPFDKNTNITISTIKEKLRVNESFDVVYRVMDFNGKNAGIFFIDGLLKDTVVEKILEFFYSVKDEEAFKDAHAFSKRGVPYVEVDLSDDIEKIVTSVLSGMIALVIDGFDKAILIDTRTYPQRETSEPEKDRVLRGSKDGFVETLISNTALIRRRIRTPLFTVKAFNVGSLSKTDVALCYIDNKVDKKLLDKMMDKISNLDVESLTMNQQSLVEALYPFKWFNPFPKVKFTERPDTATASIYDGNIVILVDNSPFATIIPTSIFDILEEADDYYFPPITGTYLRLSRYLISLTTLFITPLWLLALKYPSHIPDMFSFLIPSDNINIPIFWQLIMLELIIDGLKLASLHTPNSISTTLSIIGGIVLSDFAVKSGWFNAEAMLYMAFVAVSNYTQQSFELGYALKFLRILLLILTQIFNIWGFAVGVILTFIMVTFNKTVSGKSYLYPLIPFNGSALLKRIIRRASPKNL